MIIIGNYWSWEPTVTFYSLGAIESKGGGSKCDVFVVVVDDDDGGDDFLRKAFLGDETVRDGKSS